MFVDDVQAGHLWNFPAGLPHSIQGMEEDGCEFLLVFNQGSFSEESTSLLSDWLKHTPPDILRKNLRLDTNSLAKLPKADPLYIFDSDRPKNTLEQDRAEVALRAPLPKMTYTFKASTMTPTYENDHGSVKIVDSHNFPASSKIAAGIVRVMPGGLREVHWHPNVSEWQYWIQGLGRLRPIGDAVLHRCGEQLRACDCCGSRRLRSELWGGVCRRGRAIDRNASAHRLSERSLLAKKTAVCSDRLVTISVDLSDDELLACFRNGSRLVAGNFQLTITARKVTDPTG